MTTYYLRFPDEATGLSALADAGFFADDESIITASYSHAMDVIGAIYSGGKLLPGWHVNYIGDLPHGWDAYLVAPKQPSRMFA